MKNPILIIAALLLAIILGVYWTTFTVRFTETAVVATFGNVDEATGTVDDPGLHFRLPPPIQTVTLYDDRPRVLTSNLETVQTKDDKQLVIRAFMTWSIDEAYTFYSSFSEGSADEQAHYRNAEALLRPRLRNAMSEASRFRMDELFNTAAGGSRLAELEAAIQKRLADGLAGAEASSEGDIGQREYGISVQLVGINQINLPQATTEEVFSAMIARQEKLASDIRATGQAEAQSILSRSEAERDQILDFANLRAGDIRARGQEEAAKWIEVLNEDPELAEFLARIEFIRNPFGKRVTLVLPTDMLGMELFDPSNLSLGSAQLDLPSLANFGSSQEGSR